MVIQIIQYETDCEKKNMEELAKVLNFLDEANIDYDLEPPKKFKGYKTKGNKTYLVGEDIKYE